MCWHECLDIQRIKSSKCSHCYFYAEFEQYQLWMEMFYLILFLRHFVGQMKWM